MSNIPLSSKKTKIVKFLEDTVKKTLKKPILKAVRKGKALSEEVLEDTSIGGDKGSKANFWGGSGTSTGILLVVWMRRQT